MRVHVLGWLGAFALAACGSEGGEIDPSTVTPASGDDIAAPSPGDPPTSSADPAPAAVPAPKLGAPYPIVLMHGMAGFGQLEVGPIAITYFKDVVEDLSKNGEAVYVTLAPPYATSEVRAQAVAKQIDDILARTGKAKVNLVAHSQGGLDARVLASPNGLGYGDRIASVTTISTPHRGSKVADAVLGLVKNVPAGQFDALTDAVLSFLQTTAYELQTNPALREQLVQLSEKHMKESFNPKYVDDPNVVYKSYAGRSNLRSGLSACNGSSYPTDPAKLDLVQGYLLATALFLEEGQLKVNDGMVTVDSAKWGSFEQCVPADHLKEVGHLGPTATFDHLALFRAIVERVRKNGL